MQLAMTRRMFASLTRGVTFQPDTGVCTDEVIRSYRALGVDLQKEVHEDMVQNFSTYPQRWKWISGKPDSNIDHRRVPNLMVFFGRKGEKLPTSTRAED